MTPFLETQVKLLCGLIVGILLVVCGVLLYILLS